MSREQLRVAGSLALGLAIALGGGCGSEMQGRALPDDDREMSSGGAGGLAAMEGGAAGESPQVIGGTSAHAGEGGAAGADSLGMGGADCTACEGGGQAGDKSGAGLGPGGSGGEGGSLPSAEPECFVNGDCPEGQLCEGALKGKACVEADLYCEAPAPPRCSSHRRCTSDNRCTSPAQLGEACRVFECAPGLRCAAAPGGATCQPTIAENEPCTRASEDECANGTSCQEVQAFQDGPATLTCVGPRKEGELCDENCVSNGGRPRCYYTRTCGPGLGCLQVALESWAEDYCVKRSTGALGESCLVNGCQQDLYCDAEHVCVSAPQAGQPCHAPQIPFCRSGSYCGPDFQCHSLGAPEDTPCYSSFNCDAGLYCDAVARKCRPAQENGTPCSQLDQCEGFCDAGGHCAATPQLGDSCAALGSVKQACSAGYCGAALKCDAFADLGAPCSRTVACGAGLVCDIADGACVSAAPLIGRDCLESEVWPHYANATPFYLGSRAHYCQVGEFCGSDKICRSSPALRGETCEALDGTEQPCAAGHYCDWQGDKKCHRYAALREDCSIDRCSLTGAEGLCAPVVFDGRCAGP